MLYTTSILIKQVTKGIKIMNIKINSVVERPEEEPPVSTGRLRYRYA